MIQAQRQWRNNPEHPEQSVSDCVSIWFENDMGFASVLVSGPVPLALEASRSLYTDIGYDNGNGVHIETLSRIEWPCEED